MAVREIKTQLVLDGEREYQQGLQSAYKTVSQLGRELKLTAAHFLDNADSMEANQAKAGVLRREIAAQEEMIRSLSDRIRYADEAYEGNTEAQELYAQKIDKAMRALGKMKAELAASESAMAGMGNASQQAAADLARTESATRKAEQAAAAAKQTVDKLSGGFTVFKGVMSNLVTDALRKGGDLLRQFSQDGVELAKNLQEVDNVVSTAFGGMTADIKAFAGNAAAQFGLSSLAAQNYAGKLGAALNGMGLSEHAAEMSKTLTGLSGDMASFWNTTADESYGKIFSGVISGETEGLKAYGIVMSETNLQAFAMEQGIQKKISAMTAEEKTLLRYHFVLNATKQAQGDFAKTSGSLANQMRIAELETENAQATFGEKLAPSVGKVISRFNTWMQGDYGKRVIADTAEAAGDLAEGGLNAVSTVLGWIVEHLDTVKASAAAIGLGMLSAKVVGFGMKMTGLVRTLMAASQATGALNAVMALNPAVAVGVGIAALTLGVLALAGSYQTLEDKLQAVKLKVPQSSVDAVTAGINKGIEAANNTHEVTIAINADTQSLKEQLDAFLDPDSSGGGALTKKEFKAVSKFVTELVQPDIDLAKKQLEAQKADFQAALLSVVDDGGQSVFSEERATELTSGLGDKTQALMEELSQYKTDYIALAKQIYKDGRTPTEEEIANLNVLLEKIGLVRSQLNEAQDSATQVLKARSERVQRGEGSEDDFGSAVGYVQQRYANEAADRHAANESAIARMQTDIDTWNTLLASSRLTAAETAKTEQLLSTAKANMAAVFAADDQVDADVFAKQQAEYQALFDGMAKVNPEAADALAQYAALRDQYQLFIQSLNSGEGFETGEKKALLTPENLKNYLGLDISQGDIDAMFADPMSFDTQIDSYLMQMRASMEEKIGQAEALTDNPMIAYLQTMLDSGSLANLDVTTLDGSLETALKSVDLLARGQAVGTDLVDGITGGIGTAAGALTTEQLTTLRDAVIDQTRAVFESHSPAKVMNPVGEDVTAGLTQGMADDTAKTSITTAGEEIRLAVVAALTLDVSAQGASATRTYAAGILQKRETAVTAARSVSTGAKNALSAYAAFYGMGQANMNGFIAGLMSRSQAVTDAIQTLMAEAIQAARDTLGIQSPSRVFAQIGAYAADGYSLGFAERMNAAERLIQQRLNQSAKAAVIGLDEGRRESSSRTAGGGIHITQHVYANETSYAGQQREAARQLRVIARQIRG